MLGHYFRLTSHVPVSCRFAINRITELQPFFDSARTHIEYFIYLLGDFPIAHGYMAFPVCIDININRACYADCIRYLYQYFIRNTGSNQILSYMTGCVCGTAVYFAGVFTRESASTMSACSSVCIYNNLTSCQTRISMRASDNELAGRIDMVCNLVIE